MSYSQETSASGLIVGDVEAHLTKEGFVRLRETTGGEEILLNTKEAAALRDWLKEMLK